MKADKIFHLASLIFLTKILKFLPKFRQNRFIRFASLIAGLIMLSFLVWRLLTLFSGIFEGFQTLEVVPDKLRGSTIEFRYAMAASTGFPPSQKLGYAMVDKPVCWSFSRSSIDTLSLSLGDTSQSWI